MIIDSHVHISKGIWEGRGLKNHLLKEMKRSGVDKAIVIPFCRSTDWSYDTEEILEIISEEDKLIPLGSVSMSKFSKKDLRKLNSLLKKGAIRGIKLYPGYEYVYPNDKKLDPVFRLCEKSGFPLMIHSGDTASFSKDARVKFSHPLAIDDIAVKFPKLKIIIAHLGNPWTDDCAELLQKNDNVYADISGFFYDLKYARYNKLAARKINDVTAFAGGSKLLFGTDWPLVGMKEYLNFIMKTLKFTKKEECDLLYKNAVSLFRIED